MTSRAAALLVATLGLAASRPAAAESHKLLVLQSEGRVDAATRAKIDGAIVKLASAAEPQVAAGDLNFTDAATAVGCKPDAPVCKDEVIAMLGVDEIVITAVAPKPGGIEVAVRRISRGGATREATMLLPTGAPPDRLDGIAPVFTSAAEPPPPAINERPGEEPRPVPAPTVAQEPPRSVVTQPAPGPASPPVDEPSPQRQRYELIGMGSGAGLVVLGFILWGAASSTQGDINKAPTTTSEDLQHLKDLESKGDTYATLGNVFTIGGLALGGVSTYFFFRDRRAASATTSARLTPTVLDHGAGLVLTIGAAP
jgi:hypothetical protein